MTSIDLICCPYDSGRKDWRCGLGPKRILEQDAIATIQATGTDVRLVEIETRVEYCSEADLVFEALRKISENTADARRSGRLPLVLGGNCSTAVGSVSGIDAAACGVIWFDAHGDFCTPESTDTGFLDGMGLAMMVGRCWRNVLSTVPGYEPILESATALVGARDFDPWEVEDIAGSAITVLDVEGIRTAGVRSVFEPFLENFVREVDQVYLHIDLDVHDPGEAPANYFNAPGGLKAKEVLEAIDLIGHHVDIAGAGMASYDPSFDPDGKTAKVAVGVLQALIATRQAV